MKSNPKYILLMKAGPYCGYSLDEIIEIKQKEEKLCGKYFWGYSGVFCHPNVIKTFVSNAINENEKVMILFSTTKSSFTSTKVDKFTSFSKNKDEWIDLPKDVLLVGNKSAGHFAITGKNLEKVDFKINLSEYCVMNGIFPDENRYLDKYYKFRVDKACGYYFPRSENKKKSEDIKERNILIDYMSELVDPYSVYIK